MTVSSSTNRVDYIGNNATYIYAYPFKIFNITDLNVAKIDTLGNSVTLSNNTDYTVSGVGNSAGGNVTLLVALPTNYTLVIRRIMPITQETHFRNEGAFYAERHEDAFDKSIMVAQQIEEGLDRTITLPLGSEDVSAILPVPVAGHALVWNSDGSALINAAVPSATLQNDLANTSNVALGDALVSVTQPLAGAVSRTQHARNMDFISVRDFGATGNGVTDDTAAVNAAIAALAARGGGRRNPDRARPGVCP